MALASVGAYNIHTSILPKYRGAAPIQYAIINGDSKTGVSIQKMVKKMDAGDILFQEEIQIDPQETGQQLYTRLKFLAATSCSDFIHGLSNNSLTIRVQDESAVTFAPTLKKEDGFIDFRNRTYDEIFNQVRALTPWPGTYTMFNGGKRLKIIEIEKFESNAQPGKVDTKLGSLVVGCKDAGIRLSVIQLPGKNQATDREVLNGLREEITIDT